MCQCRDGRLDYGGLFSFILIAIIMTSILANQEIGNAVIDAIIPTFYSAILVLGAELYKVSLSALLFPFCLVIGLICYYVFVYRPAKAAHRQRGKLLRQAELETEATGRRNRLRKHSGRESSKGPEGRLNSLYEYVSRVSNMLIISVQSGIANLSYNKMKLHKLKKCADRQRWCAMNSPASFQGTITLVSEDEAGGVYKNYPVRRNISTAGSNLSHRGSAPPPEILRTMMSATNRSRSHGAIPYQPRSSHGSTKGLWEANELVIMKCLEGDRSSKQLRPMIIFDSEQAVSRIRSNLSARAPTNAKGRIVYEETERDDEYESMLEVPVDDLVEQFDDVFDYFYPDGIKMSEVEREEGYDSFTIWLQQQELNFKLRLDGAVYYEVQMIEFNLFESWFLDHLMAAIHNIMVDRLINHTLLYTPLIKKNISIAAASAHLIDSGAMTANRRESYASMKFLNVLTPEILLDGYRQSSSASSASRPDRRPTIGHNPSSTTTSSSFHLEGSDEDGKSDVQGRESRESNFAAERLDSFSSDDPAIFFRGCITTRKWKDKLSTASEVPHTEILDCGPVSL